MTQVLAQPQTDSQDQSTEPKQETQPTNIKSIHWYYSGCNLFVENIPISSLTPEFIPIQLTSNNPLEGKSFRRLCPKVSAGYCRNLVFFVPINPAYYSKASVQRCIDLETFVISERECDLITGQNCCSIESSLIKRAIVYEDKIHQLFFGINQN